MWNGGFHIHRIKQVIKGYFNNYSKKIPGWSCLWHSRRDPVSKKVSAG